MATDLCKVREKSSILFGSTQEVNILFGGLIGLGILLLILGLIFKAVSVLVTIGIILIVVGLIWWVVTAFSGRAGP